MCVCIHIISVLLTYLSTYVCFNTVPDTTGQMSSTMMSATPVPSDTSLTTGTSAMVGMTSMGKHYTLLYAIILHILC